MNIPKVEISSDKNKIQRQIEALEYFLKHDTDYFSISVHKQALETLKKALDK